MDFFYYGQWQFTLIILAFEKVWGGWGAWGALNAPVRKRIKELSETPYKY